jgi:DNA-damage-inducible protein D
MKKEQITELFARFEKARLVFNEVECWSARELQSILNYSDWRNFIKVIEKAKISCQSSNNAVSDHFVEINKMVELGSGSVRDIKDTALTRYACYLIAQNGDPSKQEIAFAQTYFAIQTRKQELIESRLLDVARVKAREKRTRSEKKLSSVIYERGVDDTGFAVIRSKGDSALFGGYSTSDMKLKLGVPEKRPLADFLPTLTIKAKDFAAELTSHNVEDKDLNGLNIITKEHVDNNLAVRKILIERGVKPENLQVAEDVKKVQRRHSADETKLVTKSKSKNNKY